MKIGIASDHAGYNLKSAIIANFQEQYQFIDFGCNNSQTSVDYPDFAQKLCNSYIKQEFDLGILICGSGIGISIAANRFLEIRAALCSDCTTATLARQHNNANVLCLGARIIDQNQAFAIIKSFLEAKFLGGRHQQRIDKMS